MALALATVLASCVGGDRRPVSDTASISDSVVQEAPRPLATDATLTLVDLGGLEPALRAVADSFAVREGVRVVKRGAADLDAPTLPDSLRHFAKADVVVDAVARAQDWLRAGYADWYVQFASDGIVIARRDSLPARLAMDSTNWPKILQRHDVRVARVDPDSDATGRHTLAVMQLAERQLRQKGLASKLLGVPGRMFVRGSDREVLELLRTDSADFAWMRESGARAANFDVLPLAGAPLLFAVSIPREAPNPAVAIRFLRFLLSAEGRDLVRQAYARPLPRIVGVGSGLPSPIAAAVDTVIAASDSTDAPATLVEPRRSSP